TLLVAFAEGHPEWTAVRHLWGAPDLTDDDAATLRTALEASGAREATEQLVASRLLEIANLVGRTALPTPLRHHVITLAHRLVERASRDRRPPWPSTRGPPTRRRRTCWAPTRRRSARPRACCRPTSGP